MRDRWMRRVGKQRPPTGCLQETYFKYEDQHSRKEKNGKGCVMLPLNKGPLEWLYSYHAKEVS